MAVSTSAVAQAAAPAGSSRPQDTRSDEAGSGFSDVLRDVSQPKDQDSEAAGSQATNDQPADAASVEAATPNADDPAGLLKLLEAAASPATPSGDVAATVAQPTSAPVDAGTLAAMLGLVQAGAKPGQPSAQVQGAASGHGAASATPFVPTTGNQVGSGVAITGQGTASQTAGTSSGTNTTAAGATTLSGIDDEGLFARFAVAPEEASLKTGEGRSGETLRAMAEVGQVRVLREETHFAPSLRLSPIQQIGEAITSALAEPRPAPGGSAAASSLFSPSSDRPMVKVLEIQLQPMELGSVKVALRLIGDRVEVVLSAQNPDTAELLKQDRQLLDQMLRAVGQKADTITIQSAGDDRPMFQINGSMPGQSSGQSNGQSTGWGAASGDGSAAFGGETRDGGPGQDGAGRKAGSRQGQDDQESATHAAVSDNRGDRSGAVYL